MLFVFLIFVGLLHETFGKGEVWIRGSNESETTGLLEVFQVEAPLRKSYDGTSCKQVIMQHDFTASYGSPYVGMLQALGPIQDIDETEDCIPRLSGANSRR